MRFAPAMRGWGAVGALLVVAVSACTEEGSPPSPPKISSVATSAQARPQAAPAAAGDEAPSRGGGTIATRPLRGAGRPVFDLGGLRAAISLDGDRLAYLSRGPGSPVLLFTVVTLPEGRRVTDFLLMAQDDVKRARGLLETGGYRPPRASLPRDLKVSVVVGIDGLRVDLREAAGLRRLKVGEYFEQAVQTLPDPRPQLLGSSVGEAFAIFAFHAGETSLEAWPRTVIAVRVHSPSPE